MPQFLFNVIASISSHLQYRIDKLLGDECYSSKKIQSIGFKAKKTLKDMHETDYLYIAQRWNFDYFTTTNFVNCIVSAFYIKRKNPLLVR